MQFQDFARPSNGGFWDIYVKYYQHMAFIRPNVNAKIIIVIKQYIVLSAYVPSNHIPRRQDIDIDIYIYIYISENIIIFIYERKYISL